MTAAERLTEWVQQKHKGQIIRRTDEPYFNHLSGVAEMVKPVMALGYEIGICHDLLEDTSTTAQELLEALLSFGYSHADADLITYCVVELTDVFTADAYPELSKKARKKREFARLVNITATAQTVKYGDLIYNINWVLKYDQKHAPKYLRKKKLLLAVMNLGDQCLYHQVLHLVDNEMLKFSL